MLKPEKLKNKSHHIVAIEDDKKGLRIGMKYRKVKMR
jgi:hypothetical protein